MDFSSLVTGAHYAREVKQPTFSFCLRAHRSTRFRSRGCTFTHIRRHLPPASCGSDGCQTAGRSPGIFERPLARLPHGKELTTLHDTLYRGMCNYISQISFSFFGMGFWDCQQIPFRFFEILFIPERCYPTCQPIFFRFFLFQNVVIGLVKLFHLKSFSFILFEIACFILDSA